MPESVKELKTFEDYKAAVEYAHDQNPEWRRGQSAFNVLMLNRPDLSEQIRGTSIDPFGRDSLLTEFYRWVEDHWAGASK